MDNAERIKSKVTGFIEPVFIGTAPDGKTLNGIGPEDWDRIQQGYACGECLATFDGIAIICPVCQTPTGVLADIPAPQLWLDHLAERANGPAGHNQPQSFDEVMSRRATEADEFAPYVRKPRTNH